MYWTMILWTLKAYIEVLSRVGRTPFPSISSVVCRFEHLDVDDAPAPALAFPDIQMPNPNPVQLDRLLPDLAHALRLPKIHVEVTVLRGHQDRTMEILGMFMPKVIKEAVVTVV